MTFHVSERTFWVLPLFPFSRSEGTDLGGSILTGDSVGPQLEVRLSSSNLGVVSVVQVTVDDLFGEGHRGVVQSARRRRGNKGGEEETQTERWKSDHGLLGQIDDETPFSYSPLSDDLEVVLDPLVVDVVSLSGLEGRHLDLLVGDRGHRPRGVHSEGRGGQPGGVTETRGQHGEDEECSGVW